MGRHNRRRTRGSPKTSSIRQDSLEFAVFPNGPQSYRAPTQRSPGQNDVSTRPWYNRHLAGQARENKQLQEQERLNKERRRLFGGDSDDAEDDGLCFRMMDYFAQLEYLKE